jgi:hypothetical protein
MKTIVYTFDDIDKSEWGPGAWQSEPDKIQWLDEATQIPCLIVRSQSTGGWCGYVGVAPGHPWTGPEMDLYDLQVHGGVTYGPALCTARICHAVEEGEDDDVRWIGFDCGHCDDLSPRIHASHPLFCGGIYRQVEYVQDQCRILAAQAADARGSQTPSRSSPPQPDFTLDDF